MYARMNYTCLGISNKSRNISYSDLPVLRKILSDLGICRKNCHYLIKCTKTEEESNRIVDILITLVY